MMTSTLDSLVQLGNLRQGQVGVVEQVEAPDCECHRLSSMGLQAGELITMLMPGNPCAVVVGQTRLVLRGDQVGRIRVSLLN